METVGVFEVFAYVLEEGIFIFFVLREFVKSRLCGVTFEAWVSEMDEPMLYCKKPKFFGVLRFFLDFEVSGWRSNVRRRPS